MKLILPLILLLCAVSTFASPSANRIAIQSQIDAVTLAGGGTVALTTPGVYDVDSINCPLNTAHKCSLVVNGSNVRLYIGAGVTLKLADNQKTNGVYLSLIALAANISNVTIEGEGLITDNAAGQSGYTEGYSQGSDKENLIGVYGKLTNFTLRGLRLEESFSCPIDIPNLGVGSGNFHHNITFENLTTNNVGEGIQCQTCKGVTARNVRAFNTNSVNVGDSFELSACEDFIIDGFYAENQSSLDLFGSKYGVVSNFLIKGCSLAIDLDSFGNVPNVENVAISNGVIILGNDDSLGIRAFSTSTYETPALRNNSISNVTIKGVNGTDSIGLAIGGWGNFNAGPFTISNVSVDSIDSCMTTFVINNLKVNGFQCTNSAHQITLHPQGVLTGGILPSQSNNYHFSNITGDIAIGNDGFIGGELTGTFEGLQGTFSNDAPENYRGKLIVRNVTPNSRTEDYHSSAYYGTESVEFNGTLLARVEGGSAGQLMTFHFAHDCVIWDDRDPDAINLVGTADQLILAGTYLTARYDPSVQKFVEISRRGN